MATAEKDESAAEETIDHLPKQQEADTITELKKLVGRIDTVLQQVAGEGNESAHYVLRIAAIIVAVIIGVGLARTLMSVFFRFVGL